MFRDLLLEKDPTSQYMSYLGSCQCLSSMVKKEKDLLWRNREKKFPALTPKERDQLLRVMWQMRRLYALIKG